MDKVAQQLFRDPEVTPSGQMVAGGLGEVKSVFDTFIAELESYSISLMDWRYYNDAKAWLSKGEYKWITTRGTHKVKPVFWLSVWEGFFKVSFFFSERAREKIMALPISDGTKGFISSLESRGNLQKYFTVAFDVKDDSQLTDIYILAEFRKKNI